MRKYISTIASVVFVVLFTSCGGDGGGGGVTPPGPPPTPDPPTAATLVAPVNNENCETGTNISDTQATVSFTWIAGQNTDSYELKISQLAGSSQTKSGISGSSTTVTLDRGYQYSWQITSKANGTSATAVSNTFNFYLAGEGEEFTAPYAATPVYPKSGATVPLTEGKLELTWETEDPDGDTLTYTLEVSPSEDMSNPITLTGLTEAKGEVELVSGVIYYWRVTTSDGQNSTRSIVYTFRTE
jgi:hypothetical protein